MIFDHNRNARFLTRQNVELRYPFLEGSSMSVNWEDGEIHCFVAQRDGTIEKVVFDQRTF